MADSIADGDGEVEEVDGGGAWGEYPLDNMEAIKVLNKITPSIFIFFFVVARVPSTKYVVNIPFIV